MKTEVYINTDIMQEVVESIHKRTNKINEIFEKTSRDIEIVQKNEYWTGKTSESVYRKYDELKNNYEPIIASMITLNDFVNSVKDAYIEWENYVSRQVSDSDLNM